MNVPSREYRFFKDIIVHIRNDKKSFLSLSQESDNKISYCNNGDIYNNQTRIKTTIGRYFRRQLNITPGQLSDVTLGKLNGHLFGQFVDNKSYFKLVNGQEIINCYKKSYGHHSCMTGDCSNLVELYALNPDKVSLLLFNNGTKARALLWNIGDKKILDRIYPDDGYHIDAYKKYCDDHGYIYRIHRGYPGDYTVALSDNETYTITLKHGGIFPYLDTFTFGEIYGNYVTLSNDHNFGNCVFKCQDGDYENNDNICCNCGERVNNDTCFNYDNEIYCEDCYCELFICCEECNENVPNEDTTLAHSKNGYEIDVCKYCLDHYYTECEDCGKYFHNDNINECGAINLCNECIENYVQCEDCGEYVKSDYVTIEDTDEIICCDCKDNYYYCEECDKYFFNQRDLFLNCKEYKNENCKDCPERKKEPVQKDQSIIQLEDVKNAMFSDYRRHYENRQTNAN